MSVPVQRTWTTGEIVTAAEMNSNIRDSVNFLLSTPRCILMESTNVTVADTTTPSKLFWDTEVVDTDTMHFPSAQSHMIANTAGRYEFELYLHYPVFTTNIHTVHCGIQQGTDTSWGSGTKLIEDVRQSTGSSSNGFFGTSVSIRADSFLNANDYVTFWTGQAGSGTSLTLQGGSPFIMMCAGRWIASS